MTIQVSEIISALKYGELSNVALSDTILDNNADNSAAYSFINRAVAEVNKDLFINQEQIKIPLVVDQTVYSLTAFTVVKVISAKRSDDTDIALNDYTNSEESILSTSFDTIEYTGEHLQVDDYITLRCLKSIPKVTSDIDSIPIPSTYINCLLSYVGYLAQMSLGIAEDSVAATFMSNYLNSINSIKTLGIDKTESTSSTKFFDKGFV